MKVDVSRIDISLVDSDFLADVIGLLTNIQTADGEGTAYVTCGWRDIAVEVAGYAKWKADHTQPKFTDPDDSAHVGANFPDGRARAVDITLEHRLVDDWTYSDSLWRAVVAAVLAHPRLHGLDSIGDTDHIEKLHWQLDKIVP